jgi:hypothetical protein
MPLIGPVGKQLMNAVTAAQALTAVGLTDPSTALTQTDTTANATLDNDTVGANIGAFTDPPSAAEMAALRTFVNALKADVRDLKSFVNSIADLLQASGLAS